MARSECNYFKPAELCRKGETGIEPFSQYENIRERNDERADNISNYLSKLPRV